MPAPPPPSQPTPSPKFQSITVDNMFALVRRIHGEIALDEASQAELRKDRHKTRTATQVGGPDARGEGGDEEFKRRCDRAMLGEVAADPEVVVEVKDEDKDGEGLDLTSHDLRAWFQRRGIHPHEAYPEYFSEEPAMAAVTYEWSLGFKKMRGYLNDDNVKKHNRFNQGYFFSSAGCSASLCAVIRLVPCRQTCRSCACG